MRPQRSAGARGEVTSLPAAIATLREEARLAAAEAAHARAELEQLMILMREANANLVVSSVRALTKSAEAEQANRLKDEFLATVSHELRTPLNAVMGWARMLASMQLPPERVQSGMVIIERNAAALARLIEDLLDVSRIVTGAIRLALQPVDLVAVARVALETVTPAALAGGVEIAFSADSPDLKTVSGDAGRLQQVIENLVGNAIKFTPSGGRVDVTIGRAHDSVEITVADTGQGIDPDFLPHVFERFRQADGATTRRHSGLGVGLAIVRQLVELHGGTVSAASRGEGLGATFQVRLPVAAATPQPHRVSGFERRSMESAASPSPRSPRLDGVRILVVDDDADGRALTSIILTQAGASVDTATSTVEALATLELDGRDVLVSDIGLPGEDGYGLIRHIRTREAERGGFLPAVALTGYARAEDRERALAAGFQAHVAKPVDPLELAAAVAALVQSVARA